MFPALKRVQRRLQKDWSAWRAKLRAQWQPPTIQRPAIPSAFTSWLPISGARLSYGIKRSPNGPRGTPNMQELRRRWRRAEYRDRLAKLEHEMQKIQDSKAEHDALTYRIGAVLADAEETPGDYQRIHDLAKQQEGLSKTVRDETEAVHVCADELSAEVQATTKEGQQTPLPTRFVAQLDKHQKARRAALSRSRMDPNWHFAVDSLTTVLMTDDRKRNTRGWNLAPGRRRILENKKQNLFERRRILDAAQVVADEELRILCTIETRKAINHIDSQPTGRDQIKFLNPSPKEAPQKTKKPPSQRQTDRIRSTWQDQQETRAQMLHVYLHELYQQGDTDTHEWMTMRRETYDTLADNRADFLEARRQAMALGEEPVTVLRDEEAGFVVPLDADSVGEEGWEHPRDGRTGSMRSGGGGGGGRDLTRTRSWREELPAPPLQYEGPPSGEAWTGLESVSLGWAPSLYEPLWPPYAKIRTWRRHCEELRAKVRAEYERTRW